MRISDWSSDVCSSDLAEAARPVLLGHARPIVRKLDHISAILRPPTRKLDPRESIGRAVLYGICDQFVQDEAHVQRHVAVHRAFLPLKIESSEERRVGKECGSTCRSRWSPYH